jgi:uncharacterized protein YcfL
MRSTLIVILFLLCSCGSRKVNSQKIQETAKIEVSEVKKENVKKTELSEKEVKAAVIELETSKLEDVTIDYKGKEGDQIEIIKEQGRLILKGSGEVGIKAEKRETGKNKVSNETSVENTVKNSETSLDSKKNIIQDTKIEKQDKQTKKTDYSVFCFIGFLLVIAGVIYLLKRFKGF